jgi:hypothetical protein
MVGILCKSDLMRAIQIRAAALAPQREAATPVNRFRRGAGRKRDATSASNRVAFR